MSVSKTIVINAINPDQAADAILHRLLADGVREDSRNGPVLRAPRHTVIEWDTPWNRISQDPVRDANPFFHWMEALWMLAGREDVDHVAYYASNMRNYSDDGSTLNGAYGYRWRRAFGRDQIYDICANLSLNPQSRREVLTMWSGGEFIGQHGPRQGDYVAASMGSKDVCCNLMAVFYVDQSDPKLNMTVFNRSNDSVLGATGANVVHFSMLQQYMAEVLDIPMGSYVQSSSNMHVYLQMDASRRLLERIERMESPPPHADVDYVQFFLPKTSPWGSLKGVSQRLRSINSRIALCVLDVGLSFEEKKDALHQWMLNNYPRALTGAPGQYQRIVDFEFPTLVLQYAYGLYKAGMLAEARAYLEASKFMTPDHSPLLTACSNWITRRINRRKGVAA